MNAHGTSILWPLLMEEARYELGEIPIGAILVKDNIIVSRHHNRRELDHDATAMQRSS